VASPAPCPAACYAWRVRLPSRFLSLLLDLLELQAPWQWRFRAYDLSGARVSLVRFEKSESHWNATVLGLAQNVLKMYHDSDMATYQDCQANYLTRKEAKKLAEDERKRKWAALEAQHKL